MTIDVSDTGPAEAVGRYQVVAQRIGGGGHTHQFLPGGFVMIDTMTGQTWWLDLQTNRWQPMEPPRYPRPDEFSPGQTPSSEAPTRRKGIFG